jgi:hypothetical protein
VNITSGDLYYCLHVVNADGGADLIIRLTEKTLLIPWRSWRSIRIIEQDFFSMFDSPTLLFTFASDATQ